MMSVIRWRNIVTLLAMATLLVGGAGCSDADESNPSDVQGFNYTSNYIAQFEVSNEGQDLSAGGPNIFPKEPNEERSGGGKSMCCIVIPRDWHPEMKIVVNWKVDKVQDGKTPSQWYTATTDVPQYGPHTYGFWVHFLPGDKIRVQVLDKQEVPKKPDDHDPYIVQGVLDLKRNNPEN